MDASTVVEKVIRHHNWTLNNDFHHSHMLTRGRLLQFHTIHGVEVFFQPIIITFPRYYMNKPTIPTCLGVPQSLSYAMYSGAVFSYHLIHLPVVNKYDFFLKLDTDIEFRGDFPIDIGQDMEDKNCLVGHTAIDFSNDCERGSLRALTKATKDLGLNKSRSIGYNWCNSDGAGDQNSLIFYGNFLAFSTKILLHPDVLKLSQYFFEEWPEGYFESRWGDQAPFVMYVCHTLDVPDLYTDAQVCDYSAYRGSAFEHY